MSFLIEEAKTPEEAANTFQDLYTLQNFSDSEKKDLFQKILMLNYFSDPTSVLYWNPSTREDLRLLGFKKEVNDLLSRHVSNVIKAPNKDTKAKGAELSRVLTFDEIITLMKIRWETEPAFLACCRMFIQKVQKEGAFIHLMKKELPNDSFFALLEDEVKASPKAYELYHELYKAAIHYDYGKENTIHLLINHLSESALQEFFPQALEKNWVIHLAGFLKLPDEKRERSYDSQSNRNLYTSLEELYLNNLYQMNADRYLVLVSVPAKVDLKSLKVLLENLPPEEKVDFTSLKNYFPSWLCLVCQLLDCSEKQQIATLLENRAGFEETVSLLS